MLGRISQPATLGPQLDESCERTEARLSNGELALKLGITHAVECVEAQIDGDPSHACGCERELDDRHSCTEDRHKVAYVRLRLQRCTHTVKRATVAHIAVQCDVRAVRATKEAHVDVAVIFHSKAGNCRAKGQDGMHGDAGGLDGAPHHFCDCFGRLPVIEVAAAAAR